MAIGGTGLAFDVAKAAAGAFSPLKAALEAASTIYNQYKVRSLPPVVKFPLTNQSPGNRRRQEQDRSPPFPHHCAGEVFREPYWRQGRGPTSGRVINVCNRYTSKPDT